MFLFLLPYRCKNPPEHYPYATIGLIALNVLVFLFTTHDLIIKNGVVADFAVSPSHLNPTTLTACLFLHGDPMHIGGNMLFLWIFGTAVEGRLRIPKFIALYFASGIVGGLLQCWSEAAMQADLPGFGASGAIMGLAGAYIYMFPYARIMVFRFFWIIFRIVVGPAEWMAWWVVCYFMLFNILNGIIFQFLKIPGGVGYFAHIGGFLAGLLLAFALRARRDSDIVSEVQATRADLKEDYSLMHLVELQTLLDAPTENMNLVLAYCGKAMIEKGPYGAELAIKMIERYRDPLLACSSTEILGQEVLRIPIVCGGLPGPFYLKLGAKLEQIGGSESAAYVYRRAYNLYKNTPDGGAALMRLARVWEVTFQNPELAGQAYRIYVDHFKSGPLLEDAKRGLARVTARSTPAPVRITTNRPPARHPAVAAAAQISTNSVGSTIQKRVIATPDLDNSPNAMNVETQD